MPANPRTLTLTDAYRRRLLGLGERAQAAGRSAWPRIEELDNTNWPEQMALVVARLQREAVRASLGYFTATLATETGRRQPPPRLAVEEFTARSTTGRPLEKVLRGGLISTYRALRRDKPADEALRIGLARGLRTVDYETVQAGRDALLAAVETDERTTGWKRQVAGTCAACMSLSGESAPHFEVHPHCQCIPVPSVAGVIERVAIPTGAALFAAMTVEEQDAAIGPAAAEQVRSGDAELGDFVAHSDQATQDDFITQARAT